MAFFRFSRDKRGNENFYLVQPTVRRGKSRTRILYWFHSPPGVRVGRQPFDEATRRALEAQNPDVIFDWKTIVETPIPSGDTEKWRERRRAERALKQAAREDEASENASAEGDADAASDVDAASEPTSLEAADAAVRDPVAAAGATTEDAAESPASGSPAQASGDARRRKRRRRRGRRSGDTPQAPQAAEAATPATPSEPAGPPEPVGD
jgi:hypothetical protein